MNNTVLTPTLYKIAELVAMDLSNKEIADKVNRSVHTVKNNVKRIMEQWNVNSRVGIAVKYLLNKIFTMSYKELSNVQRNLQGNVLSIELIPNSISDNEFKKMLKSLEYFDGSEDETILQGTYKGSTFTIGHGVSEFEVEDLNAMLTDEQTKSLELALNNYIDNEESEIREEGEIRPSAQERRDYNYYHNY